MDRNGSSKPHAVRNVRTFGDLIDLHDEDMHEVGKPPRRSKAAVMASLKTELGSVKLPALNRERLIEFGRKRAQEGAGPATLAIDLSFIRTIITHAAAVHGIEVSAGEARLARVALSHLNLVGRGKERDRRPTQDELDELIEYFETNLRQLIPMGRIVRYAVATTFQRVRQRTVHGAGERILLVGTLQCQRHDAACHLGLDVFGHKILLQATARAGTLTSAPSRKPVRRCRMICSASVIMRSINSFTEGMS